MAFDPSTATEFDPSSAVEVTAGFDPSSASEIPVTAPKLTTMQQFQADAKADWDKRKTAPVIGPVGQIETGMNMVSGMGASAVGGLAGIAGSMLPGPHGQGAEWTKTVQNAGTYQPRTEAGRIASESVAAPMTVANDVSKYLGGKIGSVFGNEAAGEFAGEVAPTIVGSIFGIKVPLKSIATTKYSGVGNVPLPSLTNARTNARTNADRSYAPITEAKSQAASTADWQRAPAIEAAQLANKYGINIDASVSNPKLTTKAATTVAGGSNKVAEGLARSNASTWGNAYKDSVGLSKDITLKKPVFQALRQRMAAPYREVAKIENIASIPEIVADIRKISVPDVITKEASAPKVAHLVDAAVAKAERGMNGAQILEEIKTLRKTGNSLKSKFNDPIALAEGDAHLAIASKFEELLDANLVNNPNLLGRVRSARTDIAQSYIAQNATDLVTGRLDPTVIAKQMADGEYVTGTLADLGTIAGNFPHIAKTSPTIWDTAKGHLSRAGVGGSLGFAAGSMVGAPFVGAVVGSAVSDLAGMMTNKRIRSSAYQAKNAVPVDRRIMPTPESPPQRGLVPYVSPTEVVGEMPYRPNFTRGKVDPNPTFVGEDYAIPRLGLSKDPAGVTPRRQPLAPEDVSPKVSFPNDKVKAEYVRLQQEMAVNQAKQEALAASANRNVNSMFDDMGPQDLSKQGSTLKQMMAQKKLEVENAALIDKMNELTDKYGKSRPSSRGYTQGDKTRKFQRGMLTDMGDPK